MRNALRATAERGRQIVRGESVPAPVEGWDASSPIAAMKPTRALQLDNWFPTATDVRVRRGRVVFAHSMGGGVVESLMPYHGVTVASSKLFAAANDAIYDITSGGVGTSVVSSLQSNRWQHVNFSTSAGKFLWICNGIDQPHHWNGSAWAVPSLTITGYDDTDIIHVNAHKGRLWFTFVDSTDAGYLATSAVAGAVTVFPLGQYFTKGGHLVAMATWTIDGGDGVDDKAVFISSRGQCAVFVGTDPSSANTWEIQGVYNVGEPIGRRCFTNVAGDVALINTDGVIPLSRGLQADRGAVAEVAITGRIKNVMNESARNYRSNFGWELCPYPLGIYVLLNVPIDEGAEQHQYVMNTETGAWCRFKDQNMNCWTVYRDQLYCGGNDGIVYRADSSGADADTPIRADGQGAYNYFKSPGVVKEYKLLQAVVTTDLEATVQVGVSTDFRDNAILGTPTISSADVPRFDAAVFDVDIFAVEDRTISDWTSIAGDGYCASIHFLAQTGEDRSGWDVGNWDQVLWGETQTQDVTMRLNAFNLLMEQGQAF